MSKKKYKKDFNCIYSNNCDKEIDCYKNSTCEFFTDITTPDVPDHIRLLFSGKDIDDISCLSEERKMDIYTKTEKLLNQEDFDGIDEFGRICYNEIDNEED